MPALDYKLPAPAAASEATAPSLFSDGDFIRSFYDRLFELQTAAMTANEPASKASAADLLLFLSHVAFTRRPGLFLLDNGNFRAAQLNVGRTKAYLLDPSIDFVYDALPEDPERGFSADPSHAFFAGVPQIDSPEGEAIGELIVHCVDQIFTTEAQ